MVALEAPAFFCRSRNHLPGFCLRFFCWSHLPACRVFRLHPRVLPNRSKRHTMGLVPSLQIKRHPSVEGRQLGEGTNERSERAKQFLWEADRSDGTLQRHSQVRSSADAPWVAVVVRGCSAAVASTYVHRTVGHVTNVRGELSVFEGPRQ